MKVNDVIERMHQLNEQQLLESHAPYIGIFYIIDDEVDFDGDHPRLIMTSEGGQKNYHRTHMQFWYQTLARYSPTTKEIIEKVDHGNRKISWKYLPRGRVLCSEDNTDFVVYCDKHIGESDNLKRTVRAAMQLPRNTVFITDGAHYQCHMCKPMEFA